MDTSTSNSTQDDDADWPRNTTLDLVQNGTANDTYDTLYPVPTGMIVLLSFLYGSISVLAVVGNFLVMWIVATSRRMQSVTNCYIANLALADIVIGLFAIPFQFQAALLQQWLLPHFMCPFCPFVQALSVNVSVFTLTAIAVDRHRAIITPLSAHTSKRVAKVIIVLIWLLALSLAAPMAMSWVVVMEDEQDPVTKVFYKKPFCAPSDFGNHSLAIYRLLLYIFQYIIPLCVITFAYAHMAMKLWGARAPGNAQELRDANHMKNKKKVIKMLVLVVALFALCWLPLQTYLLLMSFFPSINEYRYINVIFFCFDWLAMSNSCYNPFIYAIYNVHCDAAGISPHWLVTAGSCLARHHKNPGGEGLSAYVTYCGDNWWNPERISYVKYSLVHPRYHPRNRIRRHLYNIGIIQVVNSMVSVCPGWSPVSLMSHHFSANIGPRATAIGWGLDRYDARYTVTDLPKRPLMMYDARVYSDSCPGNIGYNKAKQLEDEGGVRNLYCLSLPPYNGEENDPVHGSLLLVGEKLIALYLQEERRPWGEQSAMYTGTWRLVPWVLDHARESEDSDIFTVDI